MHPGVQEGSWFLFVAGFLLFVLVCLTAVSEPKVIFSRIMYYMTARRIHGFTGGGGGKR